MRSGLIKKPIVDKNGRHTSVWVRVDKSHEKTRAERVKENDIAIAKVVDKAKGIMSKEDMMMVTSNAGEPWLKELDRLPSLKKIYKKGSWGNDTVSKRVHTLYGYSQFRPMIYSMKLKVDEVVKELEDYSKALDRWDKHGVKAVINTSWSQQDNIDSVGIPDEFWYTGRFSDANYQEGFRKGNYYQNSTNIVQVDSNMIRPKKEHSIAHEFGHWHHFKSGMVTDPEVNSNYDAVVSYDLDKLVELGNIAPVVAEGVKVTQEEVKDPKFDKYITREMWIDGDNIFRGKDRLTGACLRDGDYDPDYSLFNMAIDAGVDVPANKDSEEYQILRKEAVSCLDMMMAANPRYGYGHGFSDYYVTQPNRLLNDNNFEPNRAMEWYAHGAEHVLFRENVFIKKLFPKTSEHYKKMWEETLEKQRKFKADYEQHQKDIKGTK